MPPSQPPLLLLKKGLEILDNRAKMQRDELLSRLQQGKAITEEEEQWLDHGEGNNADGEALVTLYAVISQREADEHDIIGIVNEDSDEPVTVKPSRKDALNAVTVLQAYVAGLNNRSLEQSLMLIGRETRYEATCAMKPTKISDHFSRMK